MKRYIYSPYEEVMMERLTKLNEEGYILSKIKGVFFKFEKTDLLVKYNIRYEKVEEEQNYTYLGEYKNAHFYYTTNRFDADLPCDEEVKIQTLLKQYSLGWAIFAYIFSLFWLPFSLTTILTAFKNPAQYYLEFAMFIISILLLIVHVYIAISLYSTTKHIESIKNKNHLGLYYKKIDCILFLLEMSIYFVAFIACVQYIYYVWFICLLIFILSFFFSNASRKSYVNNKDFISLMWICLVSFNSIRTGMYMNEGLPDFPATQNAKLRTANYYIYEVWADNENNNEEYSLLPTLYYECRTEKTAIAIMEDQKSAFDSSKLDNSWVDEFYLLEREHYNENYNYIFRNGNLVVRFAEENSNNLNDRILEYIEYYNKKK